MSKFLSLAGLAVFGLQALVTCTRGCSRHPGSAPPEASGPLPPLPSASAPRSRPAGVESLAPVVRQVMPSVVSISSTRVLQAPAPMLPFDDPFFRHFFGPELGTPHQFKEHGLGSGVIVKPDIVVTNNHVIAGADEIKVTAMDKREFKAKVVGADVKSDLAVLRLEGNTAGLKPIGLGNSALLELGDVVLAIGYPFGVGETVTMGIVSGLGRTNLGIEQYENFIQTDAAINPGNSGGALVNTAGQLVGINTAILSKSGGYMGIGFAIPSDMVRPIADALLLHGKVVRGFLGVSIQDLTPELASALKVKPGAGVLVSSVIPDSPAAKAGIERGDVIVKLNDEPMTSAGQLRNVVASTGVDAEVAVEVLRNGKTMTLKAKLADLSGAPGQPSASQAPAASATGTVSGLTLEPVTPDLRKKYGLPASVTSGLVITDVQPGAPGAHAGLAAGDVLLEINQKKVTSVDQFRNEWQQSKQQVLLLVQRGEATMFLVISK